MYESYEGLVLARKRVARAHLVARPQGASWPEGEGGLLELCSLGAVSQMWGAMKLLPLDSFSITPSVDVRNVPLGSPEPELPILKKCRGSRNSVFL